MKDIFYVKLIRELKLMEETSKILAFSETFYEDLIKIEEDAIMFNFILGNNEIRIDFSMEEQGFFAEEEICFLSEKSVPAFLDSFSTAIAIQFEKSNSYFSYENINELNPFEKLIIEKISNTKIKETKVSKDILDYFANFTRIIRDNLNDVDDYRFYEDIEYVRHIINIETDKIILEMNKKTSIIHCYYKNNPKEIVIKYKYDLDGYYDDKIMDYIEFMYFRKQS